MKKKTTEKNIRPSDKKVCETCDNHGICQSESGCNGYMCPKIVWANNPH